MNSVRLPAWFARASLVCLLSNTLLVQAIFAAPQTVTRHSGKAPGLIATRQNSFEIPFSIGPAQSNVVEVVLQVSTDRGKTWNEHSRRAPTSSAFPFSSRQDQEFWFAIQTIDRNGLRTPANQALKPELHIAVDTVRPQLEFEVRPDAAGRIIGTWIAKDKNIDPCSMEIQYQSDTDGTGKWHTVMAQTCRTDVTDVFRDQLAWWPQTPPGNLKVRAQIKDKAGNVVTVERTIVMTQATGHVPGTPAGNPLRTSPQPTSQQTAQQPSQRPVTSTPSGNTGINTNYLRSRVPYALSEQYGSPDPTSASPAKPSNEPSTEGNRLRDQSSSKPPVVPAQLAGNSRQVNISAEPVPQPPHSQNNRFASNAPPAMGDQTTPATTTQWRSRVDGNRGSTISQGTTDSGLPPSGATAITRVAKKQEYYDTSTTTPPQRAPQQDQSLRQDANPVPGNQAGTPDPLRPETNSAPGQPASRSDASSLNAQWSSSTTGLNQQPPPNPTSVLVAGPRLESLRRSAHPSSSQRFQLEYDIDAIGPEGIKVVELWVTVDGGESWRRMTTDEDRRSPINVEVENQGIFGFRILVISNEGLRARPPASGDPADMWVNVDTSMPEARIIAVPYGRGAEAGRLVVQWRASDANLRMRPVKLLYSREPQGPWTTIEDGIRNVGQFAWKPGMDIPDKIYLRLEVRDLAGNVGMHQLDRPIDVSGLIPRGHIRGITPLRDTQSE